MRTLEQSKIDGPFDLVPVGDGELSFDFHAQLSSSHGYATLIDAHSSNGRRFNAEYIKVHVTVIAGAVEHIRTSASGPIIRKDGSEGMVINTDGVYLTDLQVKAVKRAALAAYATSVKGAVYALTQD